MCTGIRLNAKNGHVVYGRTLEFGIPTDSNIIIVPRNYSFVGTVPSGKHGLAWKSIYAVVGANMLGYNCLVDGVNERGLAGGLFYFPDYAQFQQVSSEEYRSVLAPWELLTWILTNFSSTAEVKNALLAVKVAPTVFAPWGIVPPIHVIIHDTEGASLVVEYSNGSLFMHDNPLGVITNAPSFEWHITNLKNYSNLTPFNSQNPSLGQGSGMFGLPGDFTSPSRFVRAAMFSQNVLESETTDDARDTLFHLLNLFNIPKGIIRDKSKNKTVYDYTQWTTVSDLHKKRYYWHTYQNPHIQMFDLMNADVQNPDIVTIAMHTPFPLK